MKFLLTMTLALGAICILEASSSTKASTMDNDSVSTENQILLVRGGGHGGGHRESSMENQPTVAYIGMNQPTGEQFEMKQPTGEQFEMNQPTEHFAMT